jgi:uncharacterized protein DUF4145
MTVKLKSNIGKIHCNECRRKTDHRLLKTAQGDTDSETYDGEYDISWETTFEVFQRCGCLELVLRRTYVFSEWDHADVRYFPPRISRHPPKWVHDLPHDLRQVLEEVYRALDADNRRLPMMGARTLVDMVMVEKVGDVGGFAQKLLELEKAGFVSSNNRKILEAALDAGSAAAHRGFAAKRDEVNIVMDIVENLLQAVYVLQDAAQKLKRSTPPRPPRKAKP